MDEIERSPSRRELIGGLAPDRQPAALGASATSAQAQADRKTFVLVHGLLRRRLVLLARR